MIIFLICESQKSESFFEEPRDPFQEAVSYLDQSRILPEASYFGMQKSTQSPIIRKASNSSMEMFGEQAKAWRQEKMDMSGLTQEPSYNFDSENEQGQKKGIRLRKILEEDEDSDNLQDSRLQNGSAKQMLKRKGPFVVDRHLAKQQLYYDRSDSQDQHRESQNGVVYSDEGNNSQYQQQYISDIEHNVQGDQSELDPDMLQVEEGQFQGDDGSMIFEYSKNDPPVRGLHVSQADRDLHKNRSDEDLNDLSKQPNRKKKMQETAGLGRSKSEINGGETGAQNPNRFQKTKA